MKRIWISSLLFLFFLSLIAVFLMPLRVMAQGNDDFVEGYYKKDGTYVQPHYRSAHRGFPGEVEDEEGH